MAAEANRSGTGSGSADSYIGSLISLTSKYEIRYEGVLYDINTEESSIGLRNVRSFGTEGRKKDGPQIPPNDKIYEYILFRGSDIKDLQVKSSPVPTTPPIDHDPAIIQSHYSHPPAVPTSFPPPVSGPVTDHSSQTSQMGPPAGSSFQGGMPLHQSGGSLGPWGSSPLPPNVNGSGLAMPMYWQGYYPPPTGLSMPPSMQQPMLRPPTGLSMPPSMQQPMQYPNINSSLLSGSTNLPVSSLPDIGSPLLQSSSNHSQPLTSTALSSTLPLTFSTVHSAALGPDTTSNLIPNKAPVSGYPPAPISASNSFVSPAPNNIFDTIGNGAPTSEKPKSVTGYAAADQKMPQLVNPGASSLTRVEAPVPSLVTPSQILKSGPTAFSSSMSSELAHKDVEVVQTSPPEPPRAPAETQPPILPLPSPPEQRRNAAQYHNYHNHHSYNSYNYRGRGRGRRNGILGAPTKFTEDFDFTAMNEKFNKDEVWGHLGKIAQSKDKEADENEEDEDYPQDEDVTESSKTDGKPVYVKDDFFDSLSSNALDQERRNGRTKFSEQVKIDTETFGNFPRHRGGWGGRGPPRGGRSRGYYHGTGNGGYVGGRGRGQAMSGRGYY